MVCRRVGLSWRAPAKFASMTSAPTVSASATPASVADHMQGPRRGGEHIACAIPPETARKPRTAAGNRPISDSSGRIMSRRSARRGCAACRRWRPRHSGRRKAFRRSCGVMSRNWARRDLVVRRVHQERQRHLEDVDDFAVIDLQRGSRGAPAPRSAGCGNRTACRRARSNRSAR